MSSTDDVTRILEALERGQGQSAAALLPLVYDELRKLAAARLAREQPGQTLEPTALVHEAFLRLLGPSADQAQWQGRGHFFAAAAEAMRRILVDNARRKKAEVHGGGRTRHEIGEGDWWAHASAEEIVALDESLDRLAQDDLMAAEILKLRLFAGMPVEEAAGHLGISRSNAYRHWTYARAWVLAERDE